MERIKLVVWDADNTLWDGTVFYKDKENVKLKPGTKEALKELDKRGVKSTICSKNYYEDVETTLEKFEIDKYFEHPQIGWGLKSDAIKKLAKLYNLSFSQILFVDDDAFQRAEVSSQLPDLNVVELLDPIDVLNMEGIKPEQATEIDNRRVQILKEQRNRKQAEADHQGDFKEFLKSCEMSMTVRHLEDKDWERVCQLLNRTNELNATSNRYTLDALKESYEKHNDIVIVVELTDKFGDYGLIAEAILTKQDYGWFIKDLTVSCRTMGRGIGSALVIAILEFAKASGISKVRAALIETESNWRIRPLYEKRGFATLSQEKGEVLYEFDLATKEIPTRHPWLKVIDQLKKVELVS